MASTCAGHRPVVINRGIVWRLRRNVGGRIAPPGARQGHREGCPYAHSANVSRSVEGKDPPAARLGIEAVGEERFDAGALVEEG